jgi:hypothetical protein
MATCQYVDLLNIYLTNITNTDKRNYDKEREEERKRWLENIEK